jgi:hypothetical protein
MPWSVIRIIGVVNPMWRELARMSYLWRVPHAVESISMADLLPNLTQTPLDIAVQTSIQTLGYGRAAAKRTQASPRLATSVSR